MQCERGVSALIIDQEGLTNRGTLNVVDMVDVSNQLIPADTKWFRTYYSEKPYDFPHQHVLGANSVSWDPRSTRGDLQNYLLKQRYFNK